MMNTLRVGIKNDEYEDQTVALPRKPKFVVLQLVAAELLYFCWNFIAACLLFRLL